MHIDGHLKLGVVGIPHTLGRDLPFSFTDDFRAKLTADQVAEQLLPHIEQDEIPLEGTIIIEINPDFAAGFLNIEGLPSL